MYKTNLGITVGLFGAGIYFTCLFSPYLVPIFLAGYVLIFEENKWLKRNAVKAVVIMIFFSFITTLLGLVPDLIEFINNICWIFGGMFNIVIIQKIVTALISGIDIIKKVLFLCLGIKTLNQGNIAVPFIDDFLNKYM